MKYLTALLACLMFSAQATADCNDEAARILDRGQVRASIDALTECLENDLGEISRTWFLLGEARAKQRRRGDAIESFTRAIESAREPSLRSRALFRRGELKLRRRDRDGAEADFILAIENDPMLADPYYARGRLLDKRGDEDAALADYTRTIELDDQNAKAYFYRAAIYRKRDLDHLAVADYDRAIEIDPNFVRAHANRTFTFLFPLLPVLFVLMLG